MKIRALTFWQPCASLVALRKKKNETRPWATVHRGLLAIHAGKRKIEPWLLGTEPFSSVLGRYFAFPYGCVLGVAWLSGCTLIEGNDLPEEPERSFGDYTPGRYAWHFSSVLRFHRPVPARGRQRLWWWTVPKSYDDRVDKFLQSLREETNG